MTREQWYQARSDKNRQPEVGKYKPKFNYLDTSAKAVEFAREHSHTGQYRIKTKEEQQINVCLKAVKGLNYPTFHEKSQAKRLAQVNKKLLEMEKNAQSCTVEVETEPEEPVKLPTREEPLDMLNLYVSELRAPNYIRIPRKRSNQSVCQPCQNFNRSYLPNGQQVAVKSFREQQTGVKKLYIEDWKRKSYTYKTEFEGELYHLVRDRQGSSFRVEHNIRDMERPRAATAVPNFTKTRPRPENYI